MSNRNAIAISFMLIALFASSRAGAASRIDHILVGAADLDRAVEQFEQLTGVRPVYGGKHPAGTHNALVSLGSDTYLEIIAVQPGLPAPTHLPDLSKLKELTPVGWAVSAEGEQTRDQLKRAGFSVTDWQPGSRLTPAGTTLSWRTFELAEEFTEAPFFIQWDTQSPHPASTSPSGCVLIQWIISGPNGDKLQKMRSALKVNFEMRHNPTAGFLLELDCPKGNVVFPRTPAP